MFNDKHINTTTTTMMDAPAAIQAASERLRGALDEQARATPAGSMVDHADRAMALWSATCEVQAAALNAAADDSDGAICNARRRMVREALHVLGADALRGLRIAVLDEYRWHEWLHDLSYDAMARGQLERAVAAEAIWLAGDAALSRAMTVRAGWGFRWHLDPDEIIRTQHCSSHNVFCCPACPDEPTAPVAPIRIAVRARHADTADLVEQRQMSRRMTIEWLAADLSLTLDDIACVLRAVPGSDGRTKLRKLDVAQTNALARALRDLR